MKLKKKYQARDWKNWDATHYRKRSVEKKYDDLNHPGTVLTADETKPLCTCGCRACEGTGWFESKLGYEKCCTQCLVHKNNNTE